MEWGGIIGIQERILREMFNAYQFASCLEILGKLGDMIADIDINKKFDRYQQLAKGYSSWYKFNHSEALDTLRTFDNSIVNIDKNRAFLVEIERRWSEDYDRIMCDLLNNARRRIDEGKHDDAVAKLYRIVELIAQYKLGKKNINRSSVDTWQLQAMEMEWPSVQRWEKLRGSRLENNDPDEEWLRSYWQI